MLTDSLPTNARSSLETSPSHLARGIVSPWIERRAGRGHVDRGDHNHARKQYYGAATDRLGPIVEMSPPDIVKRRTGTWPGMAVDIVHATRRGRIEAHFCAPVHLLALYERDVRDDGGTYVEGLPKSTLRNISQKLIFVPAGHKFHDWQEPHILPRVTFFYFDPAGLALSPELGFANMSFAPRLFFEHRGLRDTALKLATLIESAGLDHRLYAEALGIVLAHELVRFNAGKPSMEPHVRGGLAAWQQRSVVAYIEDHLAEPISLATLARLVRLSPYHFCRTFKQSFGMPAHRYHNSRRIERAKALLAEPSPSVTDIGFAVGFSQTSSFTNAFRKATGMTPTAYHRSIG
jgi:AraC-like DNA-binding protein